MRKIVWITVALFLFVAVSALAQVTCKDLDEADDIKDTLGTIAKVEYGITDKTDECISSKEGYHKDPSLWVREYYCGKTGDITQRLYKDFDCTAYGYTGCEGGKCIGKEAATAAKKKAAATEPPRCGDKKVQTGEQCDPPDSICYLESKIGICTRNTCQCKLYKAETTTAEENKTTEELNATVTKQEEQPHAEEKEPEAVPEQTPAEEKQPAQEQPPRELPEQAIEEPKGVGITRAITNAVKKFFRWIASWFD